MKDVPPALAAVVSLAPVLEDELEDEDEDDEDVVDELLEEVVAAKEDARASLAAPMSTLPPSTAADSHVSPIARRCTPSPAAVVPRRE